MAEPTFETRLTKTFWGRFGGPAMVVSFIVHLVLLGAAATWVVTEYIARESVRFEAPPAAGEGVQQEIQHRVALARRAGGGAGPSAMNAQRITADVASDFALPANPELANLGMGAPGGSGFGGAGLGLGTGTGMGFGRGTGGTAGNVRDMMSIFGSVGSVIQSQRVVFVVDVRDDMLTPIKGGFDAFEIVRAEITQLVARLALGTQFNVVAWDSSNINAFRPELVPASAANKTALAAWIREVNRDPSARGARENTWKPKDTARTEGDIGRNRLTMAVQAAAEMQPESIFMIVGGWNWFGRSKAATPADQRRYEEELEQLRKEDTPEVKAAREREFDRLRNELDRINAGLRAKGRPPIVITNMAEQLDRPEVVQAFRSAGVEPPRYNFSGWQRKDGRPIWGWLPSLGGYESAEVVQHLVRMLREIGGERRARLNVALFVGPQDKQERDQQTYRALTRATGGTFRVLDYSELRAIVDGRTAEPGGARR